MAEPDEIIEPGQRLKDQTTFTEVFHRYYAPLARYALGITGNTASAADVLQDVFLKLWEDRERLTIERSLKAMLYTMVRNRALNVNRSRKMMAPNVDVREVLEQQVEEPTSEQNASTRILQRHLIRWIDELPSRRKEAFTLSRYHDLSHAEIAGIMGVSVRTVDTHVMLALRELRRRLDELQDKGISL